MIVGDLATNIAAAQIQQEIGPLGLDEAVIRNLKAESAQIGRQAVTFLCPSCSIASFTHTPG